MMSLRSAILFNLFSKIRCQTLNDYFCFFILNKSVTDPIDMSCLGVFQPSYETTPKWHGFLMIKLAAFQASGWSEQRTAEYRMSKDE